VPTMGALHEGHGTLIQKSVEENQICVVSIFVNPKQFGLNEDLSKYPRPFQKDYELCQSLGVHVIYAPSVEEMYPNPFYTQISLTPLAQFMCGKFRPTHFDGVATVVLLLLNLVKPTRVYFGQKDFQQVQIIKQMILDLAVDIELVTVPTVRAENGLALSSRNVYLSENSLKRAFVVPFALASVAKEYLSGERSAPKLKQIALNICEKYDIVPQYLELRKVTNMAEEFFDELSEDAVLAIALFISAEEGKDFQVRLIDNIVLSESVIWKQNLEELVRRTSVGAN
jgi:pantoate--beta-alanine ligase